jgi:hypothetical protein
MTKHAEKGKQGGPLGILDLKIEPYLGFGI